ncbi:putative protease [Hydrogenispora ethanolica]|uniref:Putative protease n=1 Tax=Hydrogenispora ethanolica TaxID=1082276 RepID=A0A4R1R7D7_HYDET|nr:U32 family peptidase [Hydrogenispora ethanolica]TCL61526.1 putative protease [Hydrogenispora ethanolica]
MKLYHDNVGMELLAPAGDWDALLAGLSAGADAVYLGGKTFSARQFAGNFDLPALEKAAELLHLHSKKLYVTVNTLIANAEMETALRFVHDLYHIGVDALIVQDLGLIHLVRSHIPQLELHASTQMTVHNREGAQFLQELGVRRVVLARELAEPEVAAIAETGVEVEVFVHGALCICYSGQCLMSSMIGGRSGNRGRCAQPCRMEYRLVADGEVVPVKGQYLLSPQDIALVTLLPELQRSGVRSLKIEGRMKRPEYVYAVVKAYRKALDRYYQDPARFAVGDVDLQELAEVFNRGLTTGYFGGNRNQALMSFTRPNNRGIQLGRIQKVNPAQDRVTLKLEAALNRDDIVEVWVSQGGRVSATIKELQSAGGQVLTEAPAGTVVSLEIPGRITPGDRVFKVYSARVDAQTRQVLDRENESFQIPCTVLVSGQNGMPLQVVYQDEAGNQGIASSEIPLQPARNRPLTEEVLREQLGRLGNTNFRLAGLRSELAPNLMLPLSELNQVRRQATEQLVAARLAPFRREPLLLKTPLLPESKPERQRRNAAHPVLSVWVADLEGVRQAIAGGGDQIYIGGDELTDFHWSAETLRSAVALGRENRIPVVIGLPRILREGQRTLWRQQWEMALAAEPDGLMVSDLGGLQLTLGESTAAVYINYPLNLFNRWAVESLVNPRIRQVCLSPELSLEQLKQFYYANRWPRPELIVQGPLELMVSEYCPIGSTMAGGKACGRLCRSRQYALRDRMNLDFPIRTDQFCRMHLLNSKDLCLLGDLQQLIQLPAPVFRLEMKSFPGKDVGSFVAGYRSVLDCLSQDLGDPSKIAEPLIEDFKKLTGRGITKGHYFRGVE